MREESLAVEDQEVIVGDAGLAAPVFDHQGSVVGAIGATGPVERLLAEAPAGPLSVMVKEAARALSRDLGAGRFAGPRLRA